MGHIWTVPATVLRVVDGDTIRLELDLGWHTYRIENCRIVGINAPELSTPEGQTAKVYAQQLLPIDAEVIFLSKALDKYGRPLGDIIHNSVNFGQTMLAAGYAVPYNP